MHDESYEPVLEKEIVQNAYYKDDIRYTMQFCRWILTPIGIWPLLREDVSKTDRNLSIMFLAICCGLFCFILIPSAIQIFVVEKDINIKVKLIGPTCFCLSAAIKYFYFAWHRHGFQICIEYIERDWRTVRNKDDRAVMLKYAVLGRKLTKLCAIFLYTAGISFHTVIPLSSGKHAVANVTLRHFIYSGYDILFDSQASPAYEIVLSVHCVTAVIMYNITTAACSLAAIFVTHACSRIEIIMERINGLVEDTCGDHEYLKVRLAGIVKEHVNILRFSTCTEKVLREICLLEVVVSTLTICLLEYHCMMEWENSNNVAISIYFMLLISLSFNIFIFCYIGELLVEQIFL
ncbi:hypothetical protein KPH14_009223 [Odynerus spinipes]|uniref:Odorant receptor n=1 Tax=Odynerus spinipes TaxID=1348599 RepID=A0AAD9VQF6_9HYME|nr:hypothetical protein KPH14_009223 [Odynerus spinipes]